MLGENLGNCEVEEGSVLSQFLKRIREGTRVRKDVFFLGITREVEESTRVRKEVFCCSVRRESLKIQG